MKRYSVITIGAASRDLFFRSADFHVIKDKQFQTGQGECVALGSKIDVASMHASTGGGATNAAATFARLGYAVAFFGKVGQDEDGAAILRDLRDHGIDTQFVQHDTHEPTAISVLLSTYHHGRTALVYRGASKHLRPQDLPLNKILSSWVYVTSLGGNLSLLRWIARVARGPVMMNPGAGELQHPRALLRVLRDVRIVLLNREEANTLAGSVLLPVPELQRRLAGKLPNTIVIITDEARGAWARAGATLFHSGTHRALPVVERTGAGDAFGSGFLSGLIASRGDVATALQYATANAESVMQHVGAKVGILRRPPSSRSRIAVSRTTIPTE